MRLLHGRNFLICFTFADGKHPFPLVMVGKVLEANKRWDIGKEVIDCVTKHYPGAYPIHPKEKILLTRGSKICAVYMAICLKST